MTEASGGAKPRRTRTVSESLLSIALGLEAALMFFVTVTAFGLRVIPPAAAFGGGAALFVLLILAAWLLRFGWGVWVGWVLQAVVVATGFLLPLMFFVGAGFVAIWIYCFITGRRLDARNRHLASESTKENP
ncbi:MAG TPA: DUF4233 domain-containing protein [Terrimesophilobacter sp.]|jgi:hypothetical protein|uniref:DUF4233 domain-containing protein n=1 Tax=Terrimesophilobacter sp. TaxID=2906435 RepID=UPI002F939BD1